MKIHLSTLATLIIANSLVPSIGFGSSSCLLTVDAAAHAEKIAKLAAAGPTQGEGWSANREPLKVTTVQGAKTSSISRADNPLFNTFLSAPTYAKREQFGSFFHYNAELISTREIQTMKSQFLEELQAGGLAGRYSMREIMQFSSDIYNLYYSAMDANNQQTNYTFFGAVKSERKVLMTAYYELHRDLIAVAMNIAKQSDLQKVDFRALNKEAMMVLEGLRVFSALGLYASGQAPESRGSLMPQGQIDLANFLLKKSVENLDAQIKRGEFTVAQLQEFKVFYMNLRDQATTRERELFSFLTYPTAPLVAEHSRNILAVLQKYLSNG